jgi:hypothetical protein
MTKRARFEIHYEERFVGSREPSSVAQAIYDAMPERIDIRWQGPSINKEPLGFNFTVDIQENTRSIITNLLREGFCLGKYNEWQYQK